MRHDDQPGLIIHSVCRLPEAFGKAQLRQGLYEITAPHNAEEEVVRKAIDQLLTRETVSVERKRKAATFKPAEQISELIYRDGKLFLTLEASDAASLKPGDVLDLLGFNDWIEQGATIVRSDVILQRDLQSEDVQVMAVAPNTN